MLSKVLGLLLLLVICLAATSTDGIVWETVDPGGNGWLHCAAIHPRSGHLFFSSDMNLSLLRSTDRGETWAPIANPVAGTAYGIVGDPSNADTLYMNQMGAVPATSGIWRSTDSGQTWEQRYRGEDFGMSRGQSGIVDPANNQVIYWTAADMGVRRSTDAGVHWTDVSQGLPKDRIVQERHLNELELDRNTTPGRGILYYPTNLGLWRMEEPGDRWQLVTGGLPAAGCSDVVVCEQGIVFAAFPDRGLFKSTDRGRTWQQQDNGLDGKTPFRVLATKSRPDIVYVATVHDEGIYGSQDGGSSFRLLTHRRYNSGFNWPTNYRQHEAVSAQILFIDPNDPYTLYSDYNKKTHDGGQTWQPYGTREVRRDRWRGSGLSLLTEYRVVFDPNRPKIVWFGFSDTGLMLSEDGGDSIINLLTFHRGEVNQGAYWRDKLVHSSGSCVSMAVDPDLSTTIYASINTKNASDRASVGGIVIKSVDAGWNWQPIYEIHGLDDGIVRSIVIDPSSPIYDRTVYVASYPNGVYKSEDDGKSFRRVTPLEIFGGNTRVMWLEMAPSDPKILYLAVGGSYGIRPITYGPQAYPALQPGMNGGVYRTTDAGQSWLKCNQSRELPNVQDLAVHPSNPHIVYAAAGPEEYLLAGQDCPPEIGEGGVFASRDGGINWERVFAPPRSDALGRGEVQGICINPVTPEILYAAVQPYGVYRTLDAGRSWELIGQASMDRRQRRYHSIDLNPHNPAEVWVAHFGNSFSRCVDQAATTYMEHRLKQENFVRNAGFEELDAATRLPAGWKIEQPDPPPGEQPVIETSTVQVRDGSHSLHFLLTAAYANAPSQLPAEREQRRLEQAGQLPKRPPQASARFKGPTNSWVFQKVDPYFTSLMRGRQVAVEMDVFVVDRNLPEHWSRGTEAGEIPRDPPQVYLTEVRDYNVHWMVAETSLKDLEPAEKVPASQMKNRWLHCRAVGRVSEDALSTRVTVTGAGLDSGPMDLYVDNIRLTIVQ
jgi:photosystem II stability/assembly factor-like uncharacterized protein